MSDLAPQFGTYIQNDSGMDIPPRSVVVVSYTEIVAGTLTNEPLIITHVMQFNGQSGNILITGDATIPASKKANAGADDGEDPDDEEGHGWWNPNTSYGTAYSDQRVYVSTDTTVALPVPGEEWGPVSGQWSITRGGRGFFADGYWQNPGSTSGSSVDANAGVDGNGGLANVDPSRAIFMRGTPWKKNWGMVVGGLTSGTLAAPTTCLVDVWLPTVDRTGTITYPQPYARATNNALLGMTVTNRGCYNANQSGGSGSGSGSTSPIPCRIEYDNDAQEWYLAWLGRCITVATNVSCNSSGLTVTYGSVTG